MWIQYLGQNACLFNIVAAEDRAKFRAHEKSSDSSPKNRTPPPRRAQFPYPDTRPLPENLGQKSKGPRPKPRPAYRQRQEAHVADARTDPEQLSSVYPNNKLLQMLLESYPHPIESRRKTYVEMQMTHGTMAEQWWKKVALVSGYVHEVSSLHLNSYHRFTIQTRT